jgi:hypothetical protein
MEGRVILFEAIRRGRKAVRADSTSYAQGKGTMHNIVETNQAIIVYNMDKYLVCLKIAMLKCRWLKFILR